MTLLLLALLALVPAGPRDGDTCPADDGKGAWTYTANYGWWRYRPPTALEEVNARRARGGLPPFQEDPLLTQAAEAAAEYRAEHLIAGHTGNDFAFLPAGGHAQAAGCAAWEPSWGWGSCCCNDRARYAGAGWRMGRDGRRYMHLFVRD